MGRSSILSIIHTVTIGALINFSSGNKGYGTKSVTCKQTLMMKCRSGDGLLTCCFKFTHMKYYSFPPVCVVLGSSYSLNESKRESDRFMGFEVCRKGRKKCSLSLSVNIPLIVNRCHWYFRCSSAGWACCFVHQRVPHLRRETLVRTWCGTKTENVNISWCRIL